MKRKQFLSLVGLTSASILTAACLGGCSKKTADSGAVAAVNADFTLDLSLAQNAALANAGGYIYNTGVIVAKTTAGTYIAVSQACPHQGVTVQFVNSSTSFYCPSHGAAFSATGAVTTGPAQTSLKQYQTTLTGNMLRVFG